MLGDAVTFLEETTYEEFSLLELNQHTMSLIKIGHSTGTMSKIAPLVSLFAQMAASEQDGFDESALTRCYEMMNFIISDIHANMERLE